MIEPRLFDVEPVVPVDVRGDISPGRRLTIRNNTALALGVHPATRRPLLAAAPPRTCAECVHCVAVLGARRYWKCERHRLGKSASAASDIRKSWPACELFTPPTKENP